MARKKKHGKHALSLAERYANLPTRERMLQGGIAIRNNSAHVEEPLRIDKLLSGGVIDEMQHLYGLQIITLWMIACRPFIKATRFERTRVTSVPNFDLINLSRMSAEDQFHKTMGFLRKRDHDLIGKICFEEKGAIEAGRSLRLPVNSITVYVRVAFDTLGDALARMRDLKKELDTISEQQTAHI